MDFEQLSPNNIPEDNLTLPFLKNHLNDFHEWQVECFKNKHKIAEIVTLRARYIDQLLTRLWDHWGLSLSDDLCLVAVGGYGRGELHPKSDIDLLILSKEGFNEASETKISAFITQLWDLKLDIGNSVRTL
ncbi:MAG TPA: nucleotidyltransferase domain-containing protein, partial [Psychromonas sp.]